MKAVYRKTTLERIYEIDQEAKRLRKTIDYILLTPEEYNDLRADVYSMAYMSSPFDTFCPGAMPNSMSIKHYELKNKLNGVRRCFLEACYKVLGHTVVVAPAEFH